MKVGIIDYNAGNLGSVVRALEDLHATPVVIDKASNAHDMEYLILPGVGNFTECISRLAIGGWIDVLKEEVQVRKKPLLGICLGMQMLAEYGFEGASDMVPTPGLGLIPGYINSLQNLGCPLRIPHMGWNSIDIRRTGGILTEIPDGTDFYFVHSYAFVLREESVLRAYTDYGLQIPAVVGRDNVWGTQFHPEKSSKAGFKILENFLKGKSC